MVNQRFTPVYVKFMSSTKKCNYSKIVSKKSNLKVPVCRESANSHSLTIFSSTVHLKKVSLALGTLDMGVPVHLREVSAYGRCPLAELIKP